METAAAASLLDENDIKNLNASHEAFASAVSLQDMASAYAETGTDLQATAGRLCSMYPIAADADPSLPPPPQPQKSESEAGESQSYRPARSKSKAKKSAAASTGIVSDIIGKDYGKQRTPSFAVLTEKSETVTLSSDDLPASEIWDEKNDSGPSSVAEPLESNVEEFLCKMLGDGFQLEKDVIQGAIGQCGYNMSMSIDKLLDISAGTLEKNDDLMGSGSRNETQSVSAKSSADKESLFPTPGCSLPDSPTSNRENVEQPQSEGGKDVQTEVLQALFTVPVRCDEKQVKLPPRKNRQATYGEIVSKPLEHEKITDFAFITRSPVKRNDHEVNEGSYEHLRQAVKEYWSLMKDYLKAGADAYTREEFEKAKELMEMGAFYMRKAREADEKSAQKLVDDRDKLEDFTVNIHYLEPKASLDQMKLLLTSFSGVPYIRNLKLVTGTSNENKQDRQRKRAITRLLEKEGISWTTEGNGWTMSIDLENVDHKKVTFANK